MKSVIPLIVVLTAVAGYNTMGQSQPRAPNPWLSAADRLPPLLHKLDVELMIERDKIRTYEPVIARITLTNRDEKPLSLKVRQDGAPRAIASLVASGDGPFHRHDQRLRESGPASREITLAPGESTDGEILILIGGPPTAAPFAEPGQYLVKFACQPDGRFAPVYTNVVELTVSPDDVGNAAFLDELSELTYSHYGWDRESVLRGNGEDYIAGMELLKKIIKAQHPHRIDPEQDPADKKEAELVDALTDLLIRYPDSAYSGYIARYLGLLQIQVVADEFSLGRMEVRKNAQDASMLDGTACRGDPSYKKALQYLTKADNSNLWPRTTAIENLAILHVVAQEWDDANACLAKLRASCADSAGVQLAEQLEREMAKYKAKLARRKAPAPK